MGNYILYCEVSAVLLVNDILKRGNKASTEILNPNGAIRLDPKVKQAVIKYIGVLIEVLAGCGVLI